MNTAFLLGSASALPLLVWWAAWFPGLMSSDSIDQYRQSVTFDFSNFHPITHTASMWLLTRFWETPGVVTLSQVLLMAAVLGLVAARLARLGVPLWLAVASAWLVALLPMVAITTITVWKDVAFTIALIWAFAELLVVASDRERFWSDWPGPLRLGLALGAMWALRSNGFITVVVVLLIAAVVERKRLRAVLPAAVGTLAVGVALPALLTIVLPVRPGSIEPAEVFLADVAATVVHAPDTLDEGDLELLAAVGPLPVWRQQYECTDGTPLAFDPRLDTSVMHADPWPYRGLVAEQAVQAFPTVMGHRWCAAGYLVLPVGRSGSFLHYPPFDIPENELGVDRDPLSHRLFAATLDVYQWIEQPSRWWLTWRPALVILFGIASWIGVALRRRLRPLLIAGSLFVAHLGNVALTSPAQEFRYAFGLYVIALLSVPLWWLVAKPEAAPVEPSDEPVIV